VDDGEEDLGYRKEVRLRYFHRSDRGFLPVGKVKGGRLSSDLPLLHSLTLPLTLWLPAILFSQLSGGAIPFWSAVSFSD